MRKTIRKRIALVIAMVIALAMSTMAFAGEIKVENVIDGEEYTAYKLLNYSDNGETGDGRAVSYYLTSDEYGSIGTVLEEAGFAFTQSADGTQYTVNNADNFDAAAAAAYLGSHIDDLGSALGTATATGANEKASFPNLDTGYYFVTSTAGSLCALHEDAGIATVVEKNTVTTPDKKQGLVQGEYADDKLDVNIGDTVYYDAEITIGKAANYAITATDTLSAGLTLNYDSGDITVKVGNVDVSTTDYSLTATDSGFEIVFTAEYVSSLAENDVIKIEYSAVVNEQAIIHGDNVNTFKIDYSKQHFEDHTEVWTYDAQVYKIDATSSEFLAGAGFKLYDAATGGNQIIVAKDVNGYYVDQSPSKNDSVEIMIESEEGANVRGLAPGTYYLEETTVPDGYNKLAEREDFTVTSDATAAVEITVENESGSTLPSTGGMGTTIFYVIGGILVLAAAIILISKRRVQQ